MLRLSSTLCSEIRLDSRQLQNRVLNVCKVFINVFYCANVRSNICVICLHQIVIPIIQEMPNSQKPPKARTAYYQPSFNVSGLKLNSLPQDIQNSQSVGYFKESLHKYLSVTPQFYIFSVFIILFILSML